MSQEFYSDDDFSDDNNDIININDNSQIIYIHNYKNYNIKYVDDNMILTPKKTIKYISEYTLLQPKYLTHSKIIKCFIYHKDKIIYNSDNTTNNISFYNILFNIYINLSISTIFKNSTFNFKLTNEYGKKGLKKVCNILNKSDIELFTLWSLNICALLHLKKINDDDLNGYYTDIL